MKKTQSTTSQKTQNNTERGRSITKEMTIAEVLKKYPKAAFVFIDYNLHCIGCPMSGPETVEEAAKAHHLDLEKFLQDLNKAVK